MSERMRAWSKNESLEVVVVVGTEHFDNGEFTLHVQGNGNATVEQKRSGKVSHFDTKLDAARLDALGETLASNGFSNPRTSTLPREPGDTPVVLEVVDGGERLFHADIWNADRYDDKSLAAILDAAEALIESMVGAGNYP